MDDHAAFTVRGKKFAYFLNNHHGDGIVSICTRAFPGENTRLIAAHPRKFYSPAYIGPRGWVALRLDRGTVDWDEVRDLLTASFLQVAPKNSASRSRLPWSDGQDVAGAGIAAGGGGGG